MPHNPCFAPRHIFNMGALLQSVAMLRQIRWSACENYMHMHLHRLLRTHLKVHMNRCMIMSRSDRCGMLSLMSKFGLCFLLSLRQPICSQHELMIAL